MTLGCSKNQVDSEVIAGQFARVGVEVVHNGDGDAARVVIINTCGFIQDAKEESVDTILGFAQAKQDGDIDKLYVMGCLAQRYRDDLSKEIPEVDGYFGVHEMPQVVEQLGVDYRHELIGQRVLTTPSHYAYLKVSEGCDRSCSFCAIPLIRGGNVSRTIEDLVDEAQQLVDRGVKEIMLIAQDLTYYGLDLYRERKLGALLERLVAINGLQWIRLHYTFPAGFPEDVLQLMAKSDKVCSYIDIPLQHINERILQSMRRAMGGKDTRELVARMRREVPDVAIRTTMIVGYPGETEEEFEELMEFVRETRFERLGVFTYSPEEDTPAYVLEDDVSQEVKEQRADAIMSLQEQISLEINEAKVGKVFMTMIDRVEDDYYVGRTQYDSPEVDNEVLISVSDPLMIGSVYPVKVVKAESFDLYGEVCGGAI